MQQETLLTAQKEYYSRKKGDDLLKIDTLQNKNHNESKSKREFFSEKSSINGQDEEKYDKILSKLLHSEHFINSNLNASNFTIHF